MSTTLFQKKRAKTSIKNAMSKFERERSGFEIKNKKYQILVKNNLKEEFERKWSGFEIKNKKYQILAKK